MNSIVIDGKLINLDRIHFVRKEFADTLLISFGTDFLKFRGDPDWIASIFDKLQEHSEKLSCTNRR